MVSSTKVGDSEVRAIAKAPIISDSMSIIFKGFVGFEGVSVSIFITFTTGSILTTDLFMHWEHFILNEIPIAPAGMLHSVISGVFLHHGHILDEPFSFCGIPYFTMVSCKSYEQTQQT